MATKRFLTIHFNDGSKMSMTFPQQVDSYNQMASRVQDALDANQLALEVEGELFVIPMSNVKYLQVNPAPEKLPNMVIRGGAIKLDS